MSIYRGCMQPTSGFLFYLMEAELEINFYGDATVFLLFKASTTSISKASRK